MKTINLLADAVKTFSLSEHKQFNKFLKSSYFRKKHFNNKRVYELYHLLKKHQSQIQKATSELYLSEKINDKGCSTIINKAAHELSIYLAEYLSIERFKKNKVDFHLYLAKELDERNLFDLFARCITSRYHQLNEEDKETRSYHFYQIACIVNRHKEKASFAMEGTKYIMEINYLNEFYEHAKVQIGQRVRNNITKKPQAFQPEA